MKESIVTARASSAIITGAAGGIGAATALRLARDGVFVVAADRDINGLERLEVLLAEAGTGHAIVPCDVTKLQDCEAVAEAARASELPLKGVVNNAAVGAFKMDVESTTVEQWNEILAINLTSVFLMSKVTIPLLRTAGGGAIVNVSSIHAYATSTGVAPYAAAKGGVLALTRTMALDLAPDGIRVVCIIPGAVDTPMLRSHAEREGRTLAELGFPPGDRAIGRIAQPEELAGTIRFALSEDATFITGSAIVADGGILSKF